MEVILPKLNSFEDARGKIEQIINNVPFSSVLRITCNKGAIRANHWHRMDYHVCILTKGRMLYYERAVSSSDKPATYEISEGGIFYTAPLVEHAMLFTEDSEFWCFSFLSRDQNDYEQDTVRLTVDLTKL
jgi:quercetin dioxygenase-like cupin family protein